MNKELNADSRITDRFIYNEALSVKNTLLKQEEGKNRLFKMNSLFKTLIKVPLIEVDSVEACGIQSDCAFKRTKDKFPKIIETAGGFLIRSVTSLDGSQSVTYVTENSLTRKLSINDRHAKNEQLFFIRHGYIYLYNINWDYIKVEAVFEDPDEIDNLNLCDPKEVICRPAYEKEFSIPSYLDKPLKDLLNESLFRYYHRLKEDTQINKNPNQ
jgi:hypothetical protein